MNGDSDPILMHLCVVLAAAFVGVAYLAIAMWARNADLFQQLEEQRRQVERLNGQLNATVNAIVRLENPTTTPPRFPPVGPQRRHQP